jgi:hypothetical protein
MADRLVTWLYDTPIATLMRGPEFRIRLEWQRGQRLAECVGRAQDGVHERAAGAVLLAVRADGQRAESDYRVLADVAPGAKDVADCFACGSDRHRDSAGSQAGPARSSSISLASGGSWPGGRPRANAAAVMARMTSVSRSVSRRISTRSR